MAKITHSNVLPVFDAGETGNSVFIAMEYNDGETLGQWVASEKRCWGPEAVLVGPGPQTPSRAVSKDTGASSWRRG